MPEQEAASTISARGLTRTFGSHTAVNGIDLDLKRGEVLGFLGPNGAGKTTTMHMLTGNLAPSRGEISICGIDLLDEPAAAKARIGYLPEVPPLYRELTVDEYLELAAKLHRVPRARRRDAVATAKQRCGLAEVGPKLIGMLSKGYQQRVGIAQAIVHGPDVVVLDEPTIGLDPVSRARVWEEVRRLNTELGMTIFLTTQYLEEADALADRVGIIDHGRIVAEGTPADLKRTVGTDLIIVRVDGDGDAVCPAISQVPGVLSVDARGSEVVVSTQDGSATVSPVAVALSACEVRVRDLTLRTSTLDDVFLELTGGHIRRTNGDQEAAS
jgi:ABC-2 type transport system ATP-binding protein